MGPAGSAQSALSREQCFELLEGSSLGRVGLSIDALPAILPVHFVLFGDAVLFRTIPGTRLDAATVGAVIAFQADAWDRATETYWSVLIQGRASEVAEETEGRLSSEAADPWGHPSRLVRLTATNISGRRFKIAGRRSTIDLPEPPPI